MFFPFWIVKVLLLKETRQICTIIEYSWRDPYLIYNKQLLPHNLAYRKNIYTGGGGAEDRTYLGGTF